MSPASRRTFPAIIALSLLIFATVVSAQLAGPGTFDLSWYTIDGGGDKSTGGTFEVTGTIGQPDAGGPLTGGTFSVTGGFWPGNTPAITCLGDIAPAGGDGQVNVSDLLAVIGTWGLCPLPCPPQCTADIVGGNCAVDVSDLLAVIGHWGNCPPPP